MANLSRYPRKSIRAFRGPAGELVIVAECPAPPPWLGVKIVEAPELILPPFFEIVSYAWPIGDAAGALGTHVRGGGEIPFPFLVTGGGGEIPTPFGVDDIGPTVTVSGIFNYAMSEKVVKVLHAEGEDLVKIEIVPDMFSAGAEVANVSASPSASVTGAVEGVGYSDISFDQAFSRASNDALGKLPSSPVVDGLAIVRVVETGALYGGIVGFGHHVFVRVSASQDSGGTTKAADSPATVLGKSSGTEPKLELTLTADPSTLYANMMPGGSINHPQPRHVALTLVVKNPSRTDFTTLHKDSGIVRWSVLNGRSTIWSFPDIVLDVLTKVEIPAGMTQTWSTVWHVDDVRRLLKNQGILAVAIFAPTGQHAKAEISIKMAQ